jgi:hypothetical protein
MITELIEKDPAILTASEAKRLSEQEGYGDATEQAENMYNGFQLGKPSGNSQGLEYWGGPPIPDDALAKAAFEKAVKQSFRSTNLIKAAVRREVNAVIGREPNWTFASLDKDNPDSTLEQLKEYLTYFWDSAGVVKKLNEATVKALLAVDTGKAFIRIRLPQAALDEQGRASDPLKLMKQIRLEVVTSRHCSTWENPDTLQAAAANTYSRTLQGNKLTITELAYVDTKGQTHLEEFSTAQVQKVQKYATPLDLGGALPYITIELEPLVSRSMLENQAAYNASATMMQRNTHLAGFLERFGINIEPIRDADGNIAKIEVGAGRLNIFQSSTIESTGADGNLEHKPMPSPEYGRFEPTEVDNLIKPAQDAKSAIFEEAAQLFTQISGDATASGESRKVAVADFEQRILGTKAAVEKAGRELLEVVLKLVAAITQQIQIPEDERVVFTCNTRTVPRSSEERTQDRQDAEDGYISRQTYQTWAGVDDPEAEDQQILRELEARQPATNPDPPSRNDPPDQNNQPTTA